MLTRGQWRARAVDNPTDDIIKDVVPDYTNTVDLYNVLQDTRTRKIGFYLPKWYAPMPGASFGQAAKEFLEATNLKEATGDITGLKNWTKFWKSVPWREKAETRAAHELTKNIVAFPPLVCPKDTIALTAGIDPGQGGFWFAVVAWRRSGIYVAPHLVNYGFIAGEDTLRYLLFETSYPVQGRDIRLKIFRKGIDTGGSKYDKDDLTMTAAAYDFIRRHDDGQLFGTKGMSDQRSSGQHITMTTVGKMPGPNGKIIPGGITLCMIDTDYFKSVLQAKLSTEETTFGRFTFHDQTREDLFNHLTSEEKRRNEKTRKWEWVKIRSGNHLLDCIVIAEAMADDECLGGIRVLADPLDDEPVVFVDEDKEKDWITGGNKSSWL
jgi:phage terminase large subunit GpA-like protein